MHEYMENEKGVHLMGIHSGGEFTLCGQAFDNDYDDILQPTTKTVVTCIECIAVINHCKGVKTK